MLKIISTIDLFLFFQRELTSMVMTITAAVTATITRTNTTATTTITTAITTTITATTTATETNPAVIINQNAIILIINTQSGQILAIDLLPTATRHTQATADAAVILMAVPEDQTADRVIITVMTETEHQPTATKICRHGSRK